jgi:serine/threonine protein kinase
MSDRKPEKFESPLPFNDHQATQKTNSDELAGLTEISPIAKKNKVYPESSNPDKQQQNTVKNKSSLKVGHVINNRFVLVNELGRGGMGVVYKAKDLRKEEARDRNPFIALKVLSDEFKKNPDSFIALQRETRKTQDLAHPNIVAVYDFDKDDEHVYMTMECLDGKPLNILLREHYFQTRTLDERWSVIKQMSSALAHAHRKNIIHLDLKPGNIYIKKDGTVKILDFGIARAAKNTDNTESIQNTTIFDAGTLGALTPSYASCEMLENHKPDFRDDIYALACVAYEILTNNHPFNKISAIHARFNKMTPSLIKAITKKQNKALIHGLEFNREDRVATIEQFLDEAQLTGSKNNGFKIAVDWKLIGLGFSGLVLLAVFWLGYREFYIADKYLLAPIKKLASENSASATLTDVEKEKISRMIEIAEMHFLVGRLVEPRGSNALEAYNQVLSIDPGNRKALEGINEISEITTARRVD